MSALLSLADVERRLSADAASSTTCRCASRRARSSRCLGPNGAGKTTLMRAALGLVALERGRSALGGADPHTLSARERALARRVSAAASASDLADERRSLVALGRFAHGAAPDRLARAIRPPSMPRSKRAALDALRARRMDEISGGEKARAHLGARLGAARAAAGAG